MNNIQYINNLIEKAIHEDGTTADLGTVPTRPLATVATDPTDVLLIAGDLIKRSKGSRLL